MAVAASRLFLALAKVEPYPGQPEFVADSASRLPLIASSSIPRRDARDVHVLGFFDPTALFVEIQSFLRRLLSGQVGKEGTHKGLFCFVKLQCLLQVVPYVSRSTLILRTLWLTTQVTQQDQMIVIV